MQGRNIIKQSGYVLQLLPGRITDSRSCKDLVRFIRKRDPRYKSHLASQKAATSVKGSVRGSSHATPQQPSTPIPEFVEQEWQKATRPDIDADLEWAAAENASDAEEWECVACGKAFRSEAAWDSHERSKKHMQAVERLRQKMLEEDDGLGLGQKVDVSDSEGQTNGPEEVEEPPETPPGDGFITPDEKPSVESMRDGGATAGDEDGINHLPQKPKKEERQEEVEGTLA